MHKVHMREHYKILKYASKPFLVMMQNHPKQEFCGIVPQIWPSK